MDNLVILCSAAPADQAERVPELSSNAYREVERRIADFIAVAESWGEDAQPFVELMSPSLIRNRPFTKPLEPVLRQSEGLIKQLESTVGLNEELRSNHIDVPTLVGRLTDDRVMAAGHGRVLANLIPHAEYLEVPGADQFLASLPNWREVFDPMIEFLTGTTPPEATQRRFATVLFTDIVSSAALAGSLGDAGWRDLVERHDKNRSPGGRPARGQDRQEHRRRRAGHLRYPFSCD